MDLDNDKTHVPKNVGFHKNNMPNRRGPAQLVADLQLIFPNQFATVSSNTPWNNSPWSRWWPLTEEANRTSILRQYHNFLHQIRAFLGMSCPSQNLGTANHH
jgi:hypothetical protein